MQKCSRTLLTWALSFSSVANKVARAEAPADVATTPEETKEEGSWQKPNGLNLPLKMKVEGKEKIMKKVKRVIQIPDLHGDDVLFEQAMALVPGGFQDTDYIVFTGDFIDRGPNPKRCYDLGIELAKKYNVRFLMGNHDWVTVMGVDASHVFATYVSPEDLQTFGGWSPRQQAFEPTGYYGQHIREDWDVIDVVGEGKMRTIFVHAGLTMEIVDMYARQGVENIPEAMQKHGRHMLENEDMNTALLNIILQTRDLANMKGKEQCKALLPILKKCKAERLVLGHTPTFFMGGGPGQAMPKCNGRLLFTDVAMSRWMGGGKPSILVMDNFDDEEKFTMTFHYEDGKFETVPVAAELLVPRPPKEEPKKEVEPEPEPQKDEL